MAAMIIARQTGLHYCEPQQRAITNFADGGYTAELHGGDLQALHPATPRHEQRLLHAQHWRNEERHAVLHATLAPPHLQPRGETSLGSMLVSVHDLGSHVSLPRVSFPHAEHLPRNASLNLPARRPLSSLDHFAPSSQRTLQEEPLQQHFAATDLADAICACRACAERPCMPPCTAPTSSPHAAHATLAICPCRACAEMPRMPPSPNAAQHQHHRAASYQPMAHEPGPRGEHHAIKYQPISYNVGLEEEHRPTNYQLVVNALTPRERHDHHSSSCQPTAHNLSPQGGHHPNSYQPAAHSPRQQGGQHSNSYQSVAHNMSPRGSLQHHQSGVHELSPREGHQHHSSTYQGKAGDLSPHGGQHCGHWGGNAVAHPGYSPRSRQGQQMELPGHLRMQAVAGSEAEQESDFFRMFCFKVKMCPEARCHDWAQCLFAHPGEKAARRDPRLYRYSATPCPDVKRSGKCSRGDACSMAHGVFECWLHPARYRTQPCKDGDRCPRKVCFFAHSSRQLRLAPGAAAAAAAEAAAFSAAVGPGGPYEGAPSRGPLDQRRLSLDSASGGGINGALGTESLGGGRLPNGALDPRSLPSAKSLPATRFPCVLEDAPLKVPGSSAAPFFQKPPSPICVLSPGLASPPPSPTLPPRTPPPSLSSYGFSHRIIEERAYSCPIGEEYSFPKGQSEAAMPPRPALSATSSLPARIGYQSNALWPGDCCGHNMSFSSKAPSQQESGGPSTPSLASPSCGTQSHNLTASPRGAPSSNLAAPSCGAQASNLTAVACGAQASNLTAPPCEAPSSNLAAPPCGAQASNLAAPPCGAQASSLAAASHGALSTSLASPRQGTQSSSLAAASHEALASSLAAAPRGAQAQAVSWQASWPSAALDGTRLAKPAVNSDSGEPDLRWIQELVQD